MSIVDPDDLNNIGKRAYRYMHKEEDQSLHLDPKTKLYINKDKTMATQDKTKADKWNNFLNNENEKPVVKQNNQSTWDIMVDDAIADPSDPNSKEVKKKLMKEYYKPNGTSLNERELKLINRPFRKVNKPTQNIAANITSEISNYHIDKAIKNLQELQQIDKDASTMHQEPAKKEPLPEIFNTDTFYRRWRMRDTED